MISIRIQVCMILALLDQDPAPVAMVTTSLWLKNSLQISARLHKPSVADPGCLSRSRIRLFSRGRKGTGSRIRVGKTDKISFQHLSVMESPLRLLPLATTLQHCINHIKHHVHHSKSPILLTRFCIAHPAVQALLAALFKDGDVTALLPPLEFLEFIRYPLPVERQCSGVSHLMLIQQSARQRQAIKK